MVDALVISPEMCFTASADTLVHLQNLGSYSTAFNEMIVLPTIARKCADDFVIAYHLLGRLVLVLSQ